MKYENMKFFEVTVSEKKILGSDTEIGPWFRFPILKPAFIRTLSLKLISARRSHIRPPSKLRRLHGSGWCRTHARMLTYLLAASCK